MLFKSSLGSTRKYRMYIDAHIYIYVYITPTTMQEGLHAATLFGQTRLCGIQQGTVGEAGALKTTGGDAHMGAHKLQGKQAVAF